MAVWCHCFQPGQQCDLLALHGTSAIAAARAGCPPSGATPGLQLRFQVDLLVLLGGHSVLPWRFWDIMITGRYRAASIEQDQVQEDGRVGIKARPSASAPAC
jgi:hypothetical protein